MLNGVYKKAIHLSPCTFPYTLQTRTNAPPIYMPRTIQQPMHFPFAYTCIRHAHTMEWHRNARALIFMYCCKAANFITPQVERKKIVEWMKSHKSACTHPCFSLFSHAWEDLLKFDTTAEYIYHWSIFSNYALEVIHWDYTGPKNCH